MNREEKIIEVTNILAGMNFNLTFHTRKWHLDIDLNVLAEKIVDAIAPEKETG